MRINRSWMVALLLASACSRRPRLPAISVELVMLDGPTAGSYSAHSNEVSCSRGMVGPGSWGVQFSNWRGGRHGLRSLQLVVPAPADTGVSEFYLGLVFGTFNEGAVHEIDTRSSAAHVAGSGTVRIGRADGGNTLSITGRSDGGAGISAVVHCRKTVNRTH